MSRHQRRWPCQDGMKCRVRCRGCPGPFEGNPEKATQNISARSTPRTPITAAIDTAALVVRLADFYETPEEIVCFIRERQQMLDEQHALDLVVAGRIDEILDVLDCEEIETAD